MKYLIPILLICTAALHAQEKPIERFDAYTHLVMNLQQIESEIMRYEDVGLSKKQRYEYHYLLGERKGYNDAIFYLQQERKRDPIP